MIGLTAETPLLHDLHKRTRRVQLRNTTILAEAVLLPKLPPRVQALVPDRFRPVQQLEKLGAMFASSVFGLAQENEQAVFALSFAAKMLTIQHLPDIDENARLYDAEDLLRYKFPCRHSFGDGVEFGKHLERAGQRTAVTFSNPNVKPRLLAQTVATIKTEIAKARKQFSDPTTLDL